MGTRACVQMLAALVWVTAAWDLLAATPVTLPVFPGAEGWGCDTPGGRGGEVLYVTNLNPDGPGSLQAACDEKGPRIVVFAVSGVIPATIFIEHPNITIAGQTAPGAGITIEGMLVAKEGISDVVLRHLRVDPAKDDAAKVMPSGYTAVEAYLAERAEAVTANAP